MKKPTPSPANKWLDKFSDAIKNFLVAVAEARIPPSRVKLVPKQGSINLVTGILGVVLFTAAGQVTTNRNFDLSSQILMAAIGASILFIAAVVAIFVSRRADAIVDDWNRTASVLVIVWLLALVVFVLINLPMLLITRDHILLDKVDGLVDWLFRDPNAWVYNLVKSQICAFFAGLILIFRTKRIDPRFSLASPEPWIWLLVVTVLVGFVFDISLYQLAG